MYLFVKALALPPANMALLVAAGLLIRLRWRRTGTLIAVAGTAGLYLLSTPVVATRLLVAVESQIEPPLATVERGEPVGAIVILSAGKIHTAPAGDDTTVDSMTLERLLTGVRLHRKTGLPILVTGGAPKHDPTPIARLMDDVLRRDFAIAPAWVEKRAHTTNENARFSASILKDAGIGTVYLVSQAWHLPRAVAAFEAAGLRAIPVATGYSRPSSFEPGTFIPSAKALNASYFAFHETLGLLWYRLAYFGNP